MANAEIDVIETDSVNEDSTSEQQEARAAADDLQHIEEEAKREAEHYVEAVDGDESEKSSVDAAATAFDFDQAELDTAMIEGQVEENIEA